MERVIVQRTLEEPMSEEQIREAAQGSGGCSDLHRVYLRRSYVSPDGLRMICVYEAPDAESVRILQREGGMPHDRVWTSTVHAPETQ